MNNKNDKSIPRSNLTGKYLTRNDILKMSAIESEKTILEEELAHHGILGMKWGIRRYQPYPKGHNQLKEGGRFTGNKPKQSKKVMMTVTDKKGNTNTYKMSNTAANKFAKTAKEKGFTISIKDEVKKSRIQKDIDSFKPYVKTGIKDKSGRLLLTPKEVAESIEALEKLQKKKAEKANKLAADQKKGTSAANALVSAKRKAKEKGIVDSDFLNNPNISQKAKNEVTNLAERRASKDKKRNLKEMNREIAKRSIDLTIGSNNYAADRINGEWLNNFNKKWSKEFKGYDVWTESPKYNEYRKAYNKNLVKLSNEYLKTTTKSEFTTKLGQKYTAGFLEEHGQRVMWATPAEWAEYKAKLKTGG